MSPEELLALARATHLGRHPGLGPSAERAVAMVARRALEDAVERALGLPSDTRAPFLVQLQALDALRGPEEARAASLVWSALSRVCHYHGNELPPTHAEVERWLDDVERLVCALR